MINCSLTFVRTNDIIFVRTKVKEVKYESKNWKTHRKS